MTKRTKTDQYIIDGKLMVDTNKTISANSLDEALQKSKEMDVHDFVEILGDHNDSSLEIRGVYKL